jgi:predicted O-methyltransferase YrrM
MKNPWLLNKVIDDDHHWKSVVMTKYQGMESFPVINPWELFGDFRETIVPFAFLDGGSLPTDIALLKKLARQFNNCSYFEIGTWRGESVANVAAVAKSCTTLNLSDDEMRSMGLDEAYISQHELYSHDLHNVRHIRGNSLDLDLSLLNEKFDLIFIDGDHHYEMVKNDTMKVAKHLAHDRTIVVWHDYARNPGQIRYEVMAGILDGSPPEWHEKICYVAHTLCAVKFPEIIPSRAFVAPARPSGAFSIDIQHLGQE